MTRPDRTVEQVARDRLHAVAAQRPAGATAAGRPAPTAVASGAPTPTAEAAHRAADLVGVGHREAGLVDVGHHSAPAVAAYQREAPHVGGHGGAPLTRRARHRTSAAPTESAGSTDTWPPDASMRWLPVRPVDVDGDAQEAAGADPSPGSARAVGAATQTDPGGPARVTVTTQDVQDVVTRDRGEALAAAAASYTDAYGHPLDHPGEARPTGGRRWWLSTRHAVVAGVAVVVLATGVVVRAATEIPEPPVQIRAVQTATEAGAPAGGSATPGAPGTATDAAPGTATAGAPGSATAAAPGATPGTATGGTVPGAPGVVVHVVGQVAAPGVLTLPAGSRVSDAVAAAGGAAPDADLSAVNLARVVVDGEQVHVPAHGEVARPAPSGAGPDAGSGAGEASGVPVLLNGADLTALDGLPGIGPVLAQRILDWRRDNGPFRSVEELGEVSGIGEALLSRLRPLVTV